MSETDPGRHQLYVLCKTNGLSGDDAVSAIRNYLKQGSLTPTEIGILAALSAYDRSVRLYGRYGSDGSRVAALVVARG